MATRCPLCGKKSMMANKRKLLRGHYNPVNRYRKYPNLQWAKVNPEKAGALGAGGKRVKICTSCIKAQSKTK